MKSPALKMAHHVLCFVTALGSLHVGLVAMNFNLLGYPFLAPFALPIEYIFGLAGLASLVMLFMHTAFCDCVTSR